MDIQYDGYKSKKGRLNSKIVHTIRKSDVKKFVKNLVSKKPIFLETQEEIDFYRNESKVKEFDYV